jgi:DNA polymerase-3 subunit beta
VKITVQRDDLLAQLQTVTRVASTRSAIQALSGVQVVAGEPHCELRATDMDVSLRVPLAAQTVREGVVVLPARFARCRRQRSRSSSGPPSRTLS